MGTALAACWHLSLVALIAEESSRPLHIRSELALPVSDRSPSTFVCFSSGPSFYLVEMPSTFVSTSHVETTLIVDLPDRDFDAYKRALLQHRRHSQPQSQTAAMAKNSMSGYGSNASRRPSNGVPRSTITRAQTAPYANTQVPTGSYYGNYGGAVQQAPVYGSHAGSVAGSNVTGYRSHIDVPGLPEHDYFHSGASKRDRRPEYIGKTASLPPQQPCQDLVKYRGSQHKYSQSDDDDDDDDDDATVLPADSISQVSSNRSRRSRHSTSSHSSSRANRFQRRDSGVSMGGTGAYYGGGGASAFSGRSAYESSAEYDQINNRYVMERKPRWAH